MVGFGDINHFGNTPTFSLTNPAILPFGFALVSSDFNEFIMGYEAGMLPNSTTLGVWRGRTLMHYAAYYGNVEIIQYLAFHDPLLIDLTDSSGFTPLHAAVFGTKPFHVMLQVVECLLLAGANPNRFDARGRTPLDVAVLRGCDYEIISYMLNAGLGSERSFLIAAQFGTVATIAVMIQSGYGAASIDGRFVCPDKDTLLDLALTRGYLAAFLNEFGASKILQRRDCNLWDRTVLGRACNSNDDLDEIIVILKHIKCYGDYKKELPVIRYTHSTPIHRLAQRDIDNDDVYNAAFEAGFSPTLKNESGNTPLEDAIRHGSVAAAEFFWRHYQSMKYKPSGLYIAFKGKYILEDDIDEEETDEEEAEEEDDEANNNFLRRYDRRRTFNNWLYLAISSGSEASVAFVKRALSKIRMIQKPSLLYALKVARYKEDEDLSPMFEELLTFPSLDINERDENGMSVLHHACAFRGTYAPEIIILLLEHPKINFGATDFRGRTALHVAAAEANLEAVNLLLCFDRQSEDPLKTVYERVSSYLETSHGSTLLNQDFPHVAIDTRYRIDHNALDDSGQTALGWAIQSDDSMAPQVVARLTSPRLRKFSVSGRLSSWQRGCDASPVPSKNRFLGSPLQKLNLVGSCFVSGLETYLEAGHDINSQSAGGRTLLHRAVSEGLSEGIPTRKEEHIQKVLTSVKYLLSLGASPSVADTRGRTPLHLCRAGEEACNLLLEAGCDVNQRDAFGRTPLHYACNTNRSFASAHAIVAKGGDLDAADESGFCPLHCATSSCCPERVKLLIDKGANPNAKTNLGKTALHFAVTRRPDGRHCTSKRRIVEILLKGGCDPSAVDNQGFNALHSRHCWRY